MLRGCLAQNYFLGLLIFARNSIAFGAHILAYAMMCAFFDIQIIAAVGPLALIAGACIWYIYHYGESEKKRDSAG